MTIICAWCKKPQGEKPGNGISHTICPKCKDKFFKGEYDKYHSEHVGNDNLTKEMRRDNPTNNR